MQTDQTISSKPETPAQNTQKNDTMQALIPTKNMPALLSYYFGVFGFIPFFLLFTIAALILGFIGLAQYKTNPTPGAKAHAITGIVCGFIQILIFCVFIVLLVVGA